MSDADAANFAVVCRDVVKTYGADSAKVYALRGVDLSIRFGELMMLVGPSGCGKTTLISVMAGILDQDTGDCRVLGHDFHRMSTADKTSIRATDIGFVFQAFNLIPALTAAENAAVPLMINGMKRVQAIDQGRAMLERVGLKNRAHALPSQLSGGQQQRVAIARALVHNPRLIVCDEPTSALDHTTGHDVMNLLREIARGDDRALVIVTHDARIFDFADRIAHMDDGRIVQVTDKSNQPQASSTSQKAHHA